MKDNEVRIGNWIAESNGKPFRVDPRTIALLWEGSAPLFHGIELNIEILKNCGFEKRAGGFNGVLNYIIWVEPIHKIRIIEVGNLFQFHYVDHTLNVVSLHQLQNLYFALTGEELTVKL
jgi:hypothetical protein